METVLTISSIVMGIGFLVMICAFCFGNDRGAKWFKDKFFLGLMCFFGGGIVAGLSLILIGVS